MAWQSREEVSAEMKTKSLSAKLKEMGFDEKTFMVIGKHDTIRVSDYCDNNGNRIENPYLTFGGNYIRPSDDGRMMTDFERYDKQMAENSSGKVAVGLVGSNNGYYCAKIFGQDEMIITKDPETYYALRDQLGLSEGMGVPLSNGGTIMDYNKRQEFESMKWHCTRKEDEKGQEKRTAAVQRADIITTYDPDKKNPDGTYKNVRHYQVGENGILHPMDEYQAAYHLQRLGHEADNPQSISKGERVDMSVIKNASINYGGR